MRFTDFHMHTTFSGDGISTMEEMINAAIDKHLDIICFTDHLDLDFNGNDAFCVDLDKYVKEYTRLKELYCSRIQLCFGVEMGLQPHLNDTLQAIATSYPFDFIIGSSHLAGGIDPYDPAYFLNRSEEEAHHAYFESILHNIKAYKNFDVYGHLDYVVRYGPTKNRSYTYQQHSDIIDEVLTELIHSQIGIEINTSGIRYGLNQCHPHSEIIKRYRELGGEIITIGSDAHRVEHIGADYTSAVEILKNAGLKYHTIFKNRQPSFIKL